ncbi:MAG: EVE domain-containing protein [Phycisphaerae bacterium]
MAYWLLKTEPGEYSFDDLLRDKKATWNGVSNAAALKNMRAMAVGDELLIYHTGDERQVVGTARVVKAAYPDPNETDERLVVIDLKPGNRLPTPVTLAMIKADKRFAGWDLLRIGRLSVVPTNAAQFKAILELAAG